MGQLLPDDDPAMIGWNAPIAVLRCSHAEWRGSTLTRPSRRRQQTVGSAEKRTFAPDLTRPK